MWNCSLPHGLGMFGGLGAALGFVFFAMALYFIVKAATKKDAPGNHEKRSGFEKLDRELRWT